MNPDQTVRTSPESVPAPLAPLIVRPRDDAWDEARQAWNLAVDQQPAAVALPGSADDVIDIVRWARAQGLRVAAQGTGHAAASHASLENTVLLKTARLREVHIDAELLRARVGAGVIWADVGAAAAEFGLTALAGSGPDVGVVGKHAGRRHQLACPPLRSGSQQRPRRRTRHRGGPPRTRRPLPRARPILGSAWRRWRLRRGDRAGVRALPDRRGLRRGVVLADSASRDGTQRVAGLGRQQPRRPDLVRAAAQHAATA
jgi:hypothetical protein